MKQVFSVCVLFCDVVAAMTAVQKRYKSRNQTFALHSVRKQFKDFYIENVFLSTVEQVTLKK